MPQECLTVGFWDWLGEPRGPSQVVQSQRRVCSLSHQAFQGIYPKLYLWQRLLVVLQIQSFLLSMVTRLPNFTQTQSHPAKTHISLLALQFGGAMWLGRGNFWVFRSPSHTPPLSLFTLVGMWTQKMGWQPSSITWTQALPKVTEEP